MSDVTPHYLGDFLGANNIDELLWHTTAFIQLLEREFSPSDSSASQWMNRILAYISDHYMEPHLTITAIAHHFGLHPQQLSRDFMRLVGTSPSAYLMDIRLDRAKQLLNGGEIPVYRVGELVGIANATYFIRVFRKYTGVTPNEYRGKPV